MFVKKTRPRLAIVSRDTRLQGLMRKFGTRGQAAFRFRGAKVASLAQDGMLDKAAAVQSAEHDEDFDALVEEDSVYQRSLSELTRQLDLGLPVQHLDRTLLHSVDFSQCACVVVLGPDGLVANTAKYAHDVPIVGVNPDPDRIDGVLLPFLMPEARDVVQRTLQGQAPTRSVALAEARLHDGQRMLAFNDLFIGASSHVSARYELSVTEEGRSRSESQSSSGVLVSTGAGSTGWMSSVYNMAHGVAKWLGADGAENTTSQRPDLPWESDELLWAVREPFRSQTTGVSLVVGRLSSQDQLLIESQMPADGVIFSDGIESDFLTFLGGAIARIGIADEKAQLVVK